MVHRRGVRVPSGEIELEAIEAKRNQITKVLQSVLQNWDSWYSTIGKDCPLES